MSFGALPYVPLIGFYVEFERFDGEDQMKAGGVVSAVADQLPDWVQIRFMNDQEITIGRDEVWGVSVFARSPWMTWATPDGLDVAHEQAEAAATRYDDEHCQAFERDNPAPDGDG